ncbi:hypothetical protein CRG98_047730, partial [Punica granatum]
FRLIFGENRGYSRYGGSGPAGIAEKVINWKNDDFAPPGADGPKWGADKSSRIRSKPHRVRSKP